MTKMLAAVSALLLLGALSATATASHPTQICLDVEPDATYRTSNDGSADDLRAYVGATDAGHPPEQEGCVVGEGSGAGSTVDFEIEGVADPDGSFTPESPDLTCTIAENNKLCRVYPPSSAGGEQRIAAWIDFDQDDSTVELDRDEEVDDDDTDATDVARWSWTHGDPPPDDRRFSTNVTIRFENGSFRGGIESAKDRCIRYRLIAVKRQREGRDTVVARAKTNAAGQWRAARPDGARGRFYAQLRRYSWTNARGYRLCEPDRSPTIRLG